MIKQTVLAILFAVAALTASSPKVQTCVAALIEVVKAIPADLDMVSHE